MKIILRKTLVGGSKSITKEIEIEISESELLPDDIEETMLRVMKEGKWFEVSKTNPK